ncbi:MAG: hypothetical protein M1576_00160 [Deltaproteobacteria bacterium]|nr:hypothetical protein [Deltaproteobacteria bacterium]
MSSLIIAIIILLVIYFLSKTKLFLIAALVANFPLFSIFTYSVSKTPTFMRSIFTYSVSKTPKNTALYLAVFSFIVSISFLFVYLFGSQNKFYNLIIAVSIWVLFSTTALFIFSKFIKIR